jgi:hypothetical protein
MEAEMGKLEWKEALKLSGPPAADRLHAREGAAIVVVAGRDEKHVNLVYIDEIGDIRSHEVPREDLPEIAREIASGWLGRVGLVSLGVAPAKPPPPPPGPIGHDAIHAAKLNAVGAVGVLVELAALHVAFGRQH